MYKAGYTHRMDACSFSIAVFLRRKLWTIKRSSRQTATSTKSYENGPNRYERRTKSFSGDNIYKIFNHAIGHYRRYFLNFHKSYEAMNSLWKSIAASLVFYSRRIRPWTIKTERIMENSQEFLSVLGKKFTHDKCRTLKKRKIFLTNSFLNLIIWNCFLSEHKNLK